MLLLATAILVIGLPMNMLSLGRDDDSELMVGERFGWWFADAVYNQYLIMLGEFEIRENFMSGAASGLVISMFLGATFFT